MWSGLAGRISKYLGGVDHLLPKVGSRNMPWISFKVHILISVHCGKKS